MAKDTAIEWADATANFWIGCTKDGAGCVNCYAEADWDKRKHRVQWGDRGERSYCKAGWSLIRRLHAIALANGGVDPELGHRRAVFVNSLSDSFDPHPSIAWRARMLDEIEACDGVDSLLLTKRIENVAGMVPSRWLAAWPRHVALGISVPTQKEADQDVPQLVRLKRAAGIRTVFLSIEPLVGPVTIPLELLRQIDWVIVGGESGKHARPMHPDWVRALRDACAEAGVPFFFKQWGDWLPWEPEHVPGWKSQNGGWLDGNTLPDFNDADLTDWTDACLYDGDDVCCHQRVGKHAAGRLLDGVLHNDRPEALAHGR